MTRRYVMAKVIIVGDGPAGLSAALFLSKNGMDVTVFGKDTTDVHRAMLYNYLGIPEITGSEFQKIAREQVKSFGASLKDLQVTGVEKTDEGFVVTTEDGGRHESQYVIIAEGKALKLAGSLDLPRSRAGVAVDREGRTAIAGLYVAGRSTRIPRSQAIISAGDGAIVALDILSAEAGKDVKDFDTVSS
jgi:thioredoxin reductase (NADPH)